MIRTSVLVCLVAFSLTAADNTEELENSTFVPDGRIIGGLEAPNGAYPYQVSIQNRGHHICGGSIISKTAILTAAHCLQNGIPQYLTVVVGTNHLHSGGIAHKVKCLHVHEKFAAAGSLANDIGLIIVQEPIKLSEKVKIIPLELNEMKENCEVILSGWGKTATEGGVPSTLQHVVLKTIPYSQCWQRFIPINKQVNPSQICTLTYRGQGACHGDSGGPLVVKSDNANSGEGMVKNVKLAGVVSWGYPCAKGLPDVFTKVSSYHKWIAAHLDKCY